MNNYLNYIKVIGLRYFIIAGIFFFLFYIILKPFIFHKKIQKRIPVLNDYAREIGYSVITIAIFALVPLTMLHTEAIAKHTTFYTKIEKYGWFYFFLAFPLMFLIHDTYFYWTHRIMHHRKLFKAFHLVHHQSVNPSPWAAYSFHQLEAIVEAGVFIVFLFI